MSFIKQYKYALLIALLVFTPTSAVVFGMFGFISGFVNWGFVVLIGIVVVGVKFDVFSKVRGIASSWSDEEEDDASI